MPFLKYTRYFNSILILIVILLLSSKSIAAFRYLQEGMQAPILKGVDLLTGEKISTEDWKDDGTTIIVFWATWSKRSLEELSDMAKLSVRFQDKQVHFIAVNVDGQTVTKQMAEKITGEINNLNISFATIIDYELEFFNKFGVIAVPSTAIIDSSGLLRYAPAGYSYTIQDKIIDSIEVLLGLKKLDAKKILVAGYTPTLKASRYYGLALRLLNKRMYESALEKLVFSIEADSIFAAPYNVRGIIYTKLDSLASAKISFEKAIELDSLSVAALAGYGKVLYRMGDYTRAIENLQTALALDEGYAPALLDMGLSISKTDSSLKALVYLEEAKELNPKDPEVHYYLGQVYKTLNQLGNCAVSFKISLELYLFNY